MEDLNLEIVKLKSYLKMIQDIEEYLLGRKCFCSAIGCVACIARVALEGGDLFS